MVIRLTEADGDKVSAAIGWSPTRSLDDILGDVVAFARTSPAVVA